MAREKKRTRRSAGGPASTEGSAALAVPAEVAGDEKTEQLDVPEEGDMGATDSGSPAPAAAAPVQAAPQPDPNVTMKIRAQNHGRVESLANFVKDAAVAQLLLFDTLPNDERPRPDDRVLLVGLIWGDKTLVELEQVSRGQDLAVGTMFELPSVSLAKNFQLVRHVGNELVLTVPAELQAEMHTPQGNKTLSQLCTEGKAQLVEAPFKGYSYTIGNDDRAILKIGQQLTLIARYVRADRRRGAGLMERVDVSFAATVLILLLMLLFFRAALWMTPQSDTQYGDEMRQNANRFTKYQVKTPPPPPKRLKELSGAKEGARAKGEEGKFGKKDAKKKDAAPSKKGAPDFDKKAHDMQVIKKSGLLAAMSKMGVGGGATSDTFGPGGLGTGINNALGGVKGSGGMGDAYGVGGMGTRGSGPGGGGTALGIGGLGTKGSGRGRGGYGEVDLGGRGKDETRFIPGKTTVVGGLPREVINRIIQRHYNEIKYCYEKELAKDPGLYGKVTVLFVIDGNGKVGDALVQQTTMSSEPVESCMLTRVRRWQFPAPQGGGTVQVTYPYVFKSTNQ